MLSKTNYLLLLIVFLSIILVSTSIHGSSGAREYSRSVFSEFLMNRLKETGFFVPEKIEEYVSVLPSYPTASFRVVSELYLNETGTKVPVRVFSTIGVHGRVVVDYHAITARPVSIDRVFEEAIGDRYSEALELFYNYVYGLRYGIPSGYYDYYRIIGIRELDIPPPIELRYRIKPRLLAIFIGFSDGIWVKGPLYIYYFAFETTGTTFEGSYSRVVITISIVIDHYNVLYADAISTCGIVHYYTLVTYSPTGSGYPVATLYGVIGVLLALGTIFVEYDEEYKYYLTLFFLFVIQIFSFLALCAVSGITIDRVFAIILGLGPWFVVLALLWIPSYVFATYRFYMISETRSSASYYSAVFEGVFLAIVSLILVLIIVFIRPFTEYLIATSGPGAVYFLVVILAGIDTYMGYSIGKLWASLSKFTGAYY